MGRLSKTLVGVLLGLCLVSGLVYGQETDRLHESIQENTAKLASLRGRIKQQQQKMASLESETSVVQRSYQEIQEEIADSQQLLSDMVQSEVTLKAQSTELAGEVEIRRAAYEVQKEALAGSLRNMYLRGQRGELEMALTSDSFSEMMTRMKVSRMMARLEAGVVAKTRREGEQVQHEQRLLDAALAEIWQSREEKRSENDRLEDLMAEKVGALRELENQKKGIQNRMLDLSLNEQKLNYILEDLEQQRTTNKAADALGGGSELASEAGQLEWPVQGELIRGFGRSVHPKFKTVTVNNGYNIAAGIGAPVSAVANGSVEFSDHLPGFGQCVILDHGAGYYTLYADLDRVFVAGGDKIARGQVLAEVGRPSGSEEPQLYFEIRQGRTPLDPGDWLKPR